MAHRQSSYEMYMSSEAWQKFRSQAIERDEGKCCHCGTQTNLQVHHHTYPGTPKDGQWHLDCLDNLTTLCKDCHEKEHERLDQERQKEWVEKRAREEKFDKELITVFNFIGRALVIAALCAVVVILIYIYEVVLKILAVIAAFFFIGWLWSKFSPPPKREDKRIQPRDRGEYDDEIPF